MFRLALFSLLLVFVSSMPKAYAYLRKQEARHYLLNDTRFPCGFQTKSGMIGDRFRWPNREVIYGIDPAFTAEDRIVIQSGFDEISSKTCIRFRQRTNESYWVAITGEINSGCNSDAGRMGGLQNLTLQRPEYPGAPDCLVMWVVAHELIHAIGFVHEHSRYDRDDFVEIVYNNIPEEMHFAFDKFKPTEIDTFGVPYDYSSIMHYYGAYTAAIDPTKPTIIPKQPGAQLGNVRLSDYDVQKINRMYNC